MEIKSVFAPIDSSDVERQGCRKSRGGWNLHGSAAESFCAASCMSSLDHTGTGASWSVRAPLSVGSVATAATCWGMLAVTMSLLASLTLRLPLRFSLDPTGV